MYHEFYGLNTNPFHITPDPSFFFPSTSHKEAFAALLYGLQNRKGFVAMTGEVGSGKTTVLRSFLEAGRSTQLSALFKGIDASQVKTVFIFNPDISFKNLLRVIHGELGLPLPEPYQELITRQRASQEQAYSHAYSEEEAVFELVQNLHTELIKEYQAGNHVVLIIDEAQNMPVRTLENLRMLSNLETAQDKLLQIFLIGQPELELILQKQELRQLRQRIAVRTKLSPLTHKETAAYIEHRLQKAGAASTNIFSRKALKAVYTYSQGIPRRINTVCDNALINGFGAGRRTIGVKDIRETIADLEGGSRHTAAKRSLAAAGLVGLLLAAAWLTPLHGHLMRTFGPHIRSLLPQIAAVTPVEDTQHEPESSAPAVQTSEAPSNAAHSVDTLGNQNVTASIDETASPKGLSNTEASPEPAPEASREDQQHSRNPEPRSGHDPAPSAGKYPNPDRFPETPENIALFDELTRRVPVFSKLSAERQIVVLEMAKQMGVEGVLTFRRMLSALESRNFKEASRQMILSNWEDNVGGRAYELAKIMRTGKMEGDGSL